MGTAGCGILATVNAVYALNGQYMDVMELANYAVKKNYRIVGSGTDDGIFKAAAKKYGKKYEVIDADKLGMAAIDDSCVEYFTPMLFYTMTTVYRTALQDKRRHPLDMRRYMGVVEY